MTEELKDKLRRLVAGINPIIGPAVSRADKDEMLVRCSEAIKETLGDSDFLAEWSDGL